MVWPGQPEAESPAYPPQPSTNVARLAPNPRQSKRGSGGLRRLTAVSRRPAPAATKPPNPAHPREKWLKQAKNPPRTKDPRNLDRWFSRPPHSTTLPPLQGDRVDTIMLRIDGPDFQR
jgi:hypothetical protein